MVGNGGRAANHPKSRGAAVDRTSRRKGRAAVVGMGERVTPGRSLQRNCVTSEPDEAHEVELDLGNRRIARVEMTLGMQRAGRRGRSSRPRVVLWLVLCALAGKASAWNDRGHMIVAAIAYDRLKPEVKARVDGLLRQNPEYASWTSGVAKARVKRVAFMRAATWPDFIKSAPGYENDGNRPKGPDASRNTGYDDRLQHRYWHYIDIPFSTDGTPLEYPPEPNALTQIAAFEEVLASPVQSDALKSYDLVWLIHLVGDVHQPLHATSRFTKDLPHGDEGGNRVLLCARPCRGELHSFWDDILGTSRSPDSALRAANGLGLAPPKGADDLREGDWIAESVALAKSAVYASPIGPGAGPYQMTPGYRKSAKLAAEGRVALAGARLAGVLNNVLERR